METFSQNDFSRGSVYKHILNLAVPMMLAQIVQMMYNITDRIYIGHIPGASSMALTGLGVTFPVVTLIAAVTNLFGTGGAPLCAIERGKGDEKRAEEIMGSTFSMLCASSVVLIALCYLAMRPMLYLFGAGGESYVYAAKYLYIYIIGTPFFMISTGMNGFINAQGFSRIGMATVLIGAVINIALDPCFIFLLDMGISGAAVATVISQAVSAVWVVVFLTGKKTLLKLTPASLKVNFKIVSKICALGTAGFVMQASNALVQIAANTTLREFGGEIYVGVMTVLNSVRDVVALPMMGLTHASQPFLGYNLGAGKFGRIKTAIRFVTITGVIYMSLMWLIVFLFPKPLISVFNPDPELISKGTECIHIFFFGFFMMAFHFSGQSIFVGLGKSKQAIFFSIFRKVLIVVPLSVILPRVTNMGINGVFVAEPVSNFVSGVFCYGVMLLTVRKMIRGNDIVS